MDIVLDTEVLRKIEKDLAYNLKYLERINIFLFKLAEDIDPELKGKGTEAMVDSINELRNLLNDKSYTLYGEFSSMLIGIIERFEDIDQAIADEITKSMEG
ncbi:MAG: hypothetical protein ACRCWM_10640 [Sarcina sp.]